MKRFISLSVLLFLMAVADASPLLGHPGPDLGDVDGGSSSNVGSIVERRFIGNLMGGLGTASKVASITGMLPGYSKPSPGNGGMLGAVGQVANVAGVLPGASV